MEKIATEAARLLFTDGGAGWIVAVLLGLACLHLYRDGLRVLEARIAEARLADHRGGRRRPAEPHPRAGGPGPARR